MGKGIKEFQVTGCMFHVYRVNFRSLLTWNL